MFSGVEFAAKFLRALRAGEIPAYTFFEEYS
jgi:hypothetical protein